MIDRLPAALAAVTAPAPTRRMTAKADGGTYEAFRAHGWTDAQLVEHGYMIGPSAAPVGTALSKSGEPFTYDATGEAPVTARAGWVFVHNTVNGTITADEPDGTRHTVQRGDMNTLAGRDLLNAMTRDLTKPAQVPAPGGDWKVEVLGTGWDKLAIASVAPGVFTVNAPDGHVRTPASYPPLTHDEIVALTCMQAGAPWQERFLEGLPELFAIYERLRAEGKRPMDPADRKGDLTAACAIAMAYATGEAPDWAGFADNGRQIEARLKHDAEHLNCTTCGGSGHADDVKPDTVTVALTHPQVQALYLTLFHGRMGGVQRPETRPAYGWMEQPLCEVEEILKPAHLAIHNRDFDALNRAFWGVRK